MADALDVWEAQRPLLEDLFHREDDAYPAGTPEYEDFKNFASRFLKFRSRSGHPSHVEARLSPADGQQAAQTSRAHALGVPEGSDPRYRVNVTVLTEDQRRGQRRARNYPLSRDDLAEYRLMLTMYEDFLQKKSLRKLRQFRRDQAKLPVNSFQDRIVAAVASSPVVVIAGDTGCGKSTQVPQILLKSGYNRIACTQPRRISAVSLARRVAFETLNAYGDGVGYRIRFQSTASAATRIVFLTEGILLRELLSDHFLSRYDVVIIDEVHERHVTTDLLLAVMRALCMARPELKLVLMSATINVATYSRFFHNAPIIQVPGRTFPIDIEYLPLQNEVLRLPAGVAEEDSALKRRKRRRQAQRSLDTSPYLRILERIDREVPADQTGDLLVFLSGIQEIMTVAAALQPYADATQRWKILPLHSSLSAAQQDQVFETPPPGTRKCILSTNIAETSVTIDGVRFVLDSGKAKEMTHIAEIGGGSLQEQWISQASAAQRAGRAGRTGPGHCFRLYSKEQFERLEPFSLPEILRIPLESVLLQVKMLFPGVPLRCIAFLDPPPKPVLLRALASLLQHGALAEPGGAALRCHAAEVQPEQSTVDGALTSECMDGAEGEDMELTQLGRTLALLPVDVHLGKMLVLASLFRNAAPHVITVAAGLGIQSPFVWLGEGEESDKIRARRKLLDSGLGDAFTMLTVFGHWAAMEATPNSSKKWCKRRGIQPQRMAEMAKLRAQFQDTLESARLLEGRSTQHPAGVRTARRESDAMARLEGQISGRNEGGRGATLRKKARHPRQQARQKEDPVGRSQNDTDSDGPSEGTSSGASGDSGTRARSIGPYPVPDPDDMSTSEQRLLQYIICSGLYPHLAVPDEHNSVRRESEHFFHTAQVADARIHPSSSLSGTPNPVSNKEVVAYGSLMETTKLYLSSLVRSVVPTPHQLSLSSPSMIATLQGWDLQQTLSGGGHWAPHLFVLVQTRVPALAALLRTSHTIDAAPECNQLLFDNWLLLRFDETPDSCARLLSVTCAIRDTVEAHLNQRLAAAEAQLARGDPSTDGTALPRPELGQHDETGFDGKLVTDQVASLMDSSLKFSLRRVSASDAAARFAHGLSSADMWAPLAENSARNIQQLVPLPLGRLQVLNDAKPNTTFEALTNARSASDPHFVAEDLLREALALKELSQASAAHRPGPSGLRKAGVLLRPYLRIGSLPAVETSLRAHATQGLTSHWQCPACHIKLLGTLDDIIAHLRECVRQGQSSTGGPGASELAATMADSSHVFDHCSRERGRTEGASTESQAQSTLGQQHSAPANTGPRGTAKGEAAVPKGNPQGSPDPHTSERDRQSQSPALYDESEHASHAESGSAVLAGVDEQSVPQGRGRYACEACGGKVYLFTGPQILQHRAWHKRQKA